MARIPCNWALSLALELCVSVPKSHSAVDESLWRGCPKTRISKVLRFFPCCHGQTMLIFGPHWLPYRAAPQNVRALEQVVFCTFGDCKINKLCFFIFWPVLDLCQVFRNLPTRKLQPCSSINFAGFPDCIPRWVCKSTDGHKQKFKNCTWKCRSKMSRDPHLASVFSGWPHRFWNLSYRRDCTFFSMQKRQGPPAKKK